MSRQNPHFEKADQVFNAADTFKQRCLIGNHSLFLEGEMLWTPEHFEVLIRNYVQQPDAGGGNFYEKLSNQLAACTPLDVALMAEVFWIVQLGPINLRAHTKRNTLERIWNIKPPGPFPSNSQFLAEPVLSGLGSAGPGYNNYLWMEIAFAIEAFADFVAKSVADRTALLADGNRFAVWLDGIPSGKGRQLYHTLCHVLFPDTFERIFSQGNKNQVARHFKIWKRGMADNRPSLDAALLDLRKRLEVQHPGEVVDYYEPPVGTLIKQAPAPTPTVAATPTQGTGTGTLGVSEPEADYGVEKDAGEGATPTLRKADNLILYGPPGTGKTYQMQLLMDAAYEVGQEYDFVSFHPSYSYEDFMGGLRPKASENGSGIVVAFEKGPFLRICEKAHDTPGETFTLFIDEINRANVAKVFGELITLIEPSKRVIAGSKPNDNGAWITLPGTDMLFGVPDNLNIVATMNTADRSIAMMDVALRRRFRFQECPPEPDLIEPAYVGKIHLPSLLQKINDRLEYLLDRDHAIGHALFMELHSLTDLQDVLAQRVIPLLQEYFFEDLEKVRLVLTGSTKESPFFSSRKLVPLDLFPGARHSVGTEVRISFAIGDPGTWSEAEIMALYGAGNEAASAPMSDEGSTFDTPGDLNSEPAASSIQ